MANSNDPRVLIVEDSEILRVMMFTLLRHQPLAVDTAASCDAALEKVSSCDYALIVVDMDMANGEAKRFIEQFREERPEATTVILAVRDPKSDAFIDSAAVSAVLNKPIELDTLAEVIRESASVVPPPDDPLPCTSPAESDIRARLDRGGSMAN